MVILHKMRYNCLINISFYFAVNLIPTVHLIDTWEKNMDAKERAGY